MMEKFGDDYKKMAKDYKNYYQDTPAQLRKRIGQFKKMNCRKQSKCRNAELLQVKDAKLPT